MINCRSKIFLLSVCVFAISSILIAITFIESKEDHNHEKDINYKMIISSIYGGYGIDGQKLETTVETKTFKQIQKGDVFDIDIFRNSRANQEFLALKVIDINEDIIEVEYYSAGNWNRKKLEYNEKFSFMPEYYVVCDGANQTIELHFEK